MKGWSKTGVVFAACVSVFLCNTLLAGQEVAPIQNSAMAGGVEAQNAAHYPEQGDAVRPSKEEVAQKIQTLQVPFIANEGQVDESVAFYAKTFGGTVFVTKNGEIVYSLPSGRDVPAGASLRNHVETHCVRLLKCRGAGKQRGMGLRDAHRMTG